MNIHFPSKDLIPGMEHTASGSPQVKTGEGPCAVRESVNGAGVKLQLGEMTAQEALFEAPRQGKTLTDLAAEAESVDVGVSQDFQTLMAHTLSAEDYAKAREEGFSYGEMEPGEIVTIQDRVKAEMAKGGTVVAGYNDDLQTRELAQIVGSEAMARELTRSFAEADLPMTEENAQDLAYGWELTRTLTEPGVPELFYLTQNGLRPEIWNLYLAQNSGSVAGAQALSQGGSEPIDWEAPEYVQMLDQIRRITGEEQLEQGKWLVEKGLPVTAENVEILEDTKRISFPVTPEHYAQSAAAAVSEGKRPVHADLSIRTDIYARAAELGTQIEEGLRTLTNRRTAEQIRLSMTAEVNVRLVRSGFYLNTDEIKDSIAELEQALRKAEREVAGELFPESREPVEDYRIYHETGRITREIRSMPAAVLGSFLLRSAQELTLREVHTEGTALQAAYQKAGESYEALMTAPRADLGDSIRKAFRNADSLARELGMEPTGENLRAIRILGYNRMEISEENLTKIKETDSIVTNMIRRLTPANVLQMIRDGVNPLERSFSELERYFDRAAGQQDFFAGYEKEAESFSRFLYALERDSEISQEERDSYIGIYRMVYQIEQNDGAAIGGVVSEQAQISFSNLLSAARSGKYKGMDVRIGDGTGSLSELVRSARSITEQIQSAFDAQPVREERAYYEEELRQLRESARVPAAAAQLLQAASEPETAQNLLASANLLSGEGSLFTELEKMRERKAQQGQAPAGERGSKKQGGLTRILDAFSEAQDPAAEADRFYADLDAQYRAALPECTGSEDLRLLRASHRQLRLASRLAAPHGENGRRDYFLPVELGGEETLIHLTLETGAGAGQSLRVAASLPEGDRMEAAFTVEEGEIRGILSGTSQTAVHKLTEAADIFTEALREEGALRPGSISVMPASHAQNRTVSDLPRSEAKDGTDAGMKSSEGTDDRQLFRTAKILLNAVNRAFAQ